MELPLFGVVGLRRTRGGGSVGLIVVEKGHGHLTSVKRQQDVRLVTPDGRTVTVGSHANNGDDHYRRTRDHAPLNAALALRRRSTLPSPEEFDWSPASFLVDGIETPFEMCHLDGDVWVAVGRVPPLVVTIDSRGVPPDSLRLERLTDHRIPPPPSPDLGDASAEVLGALERRSRRLPLHRIRRYADYWALRSVEEDHIRALAKTHRLPDTDAETLRKYWLERLDCDLADTLDEFDQRRFAAGLRYPLRLRHVPAPLAQLWMNTVGPGGRTWFGNRFVGIRHFTFRLRWRP